MVWVLIWFNGTPFLKLSALITVRTNLHPPIFQEGIQDQWTINSADHGCGLLVKKDKSSCRVSLQVLPFDRGVINILSSQQAILCCLLNYFLRLFDFRITCIVWEKGQCKKVDLSVVEIGGHIEREVSRIDYDSAELLYSGVVFTLLIAAFPFLFRLYYNENLQQCFSHIVLERTIADWNSTSESLTALFGANWQVSFFSSHKFCCNEPDMAWSRPTIFELVCT